MKKTPKNSAEGNQVFTEEEEGHVLLQQLDDAEEPAKTFEEPDDQEGRKRIQNGEEREKEAGRKGRKTVWTERL